MPIWYDDVKVGEHRLDLLVNDEVLLELKAVECIHDRFVAQVVSSLRATKLEIGLIINFNETLLKRGIKRIIMNDRKEHRIL